MTKKLAGIRAVVFDQGGVLVDFGPNRGLPWGEHERAGRRKLVDCIRSTGGRIESDAELDRRLFEPWREGYEHRYETGREHPIGPHLERLRRETGATASDRELLDAWFGSLGAWSPALEGAVETVETLARRGFRLGLVSNVPLPGELYREHILRRHGFLPYLESLRFSYDAPARKPSPVMLQEVLNELGARPDQAVMVGDRRDSDVASGRAAGAYTVWIEGPGSDGPREDVAIGSIGELVEAL